MTNDPHDMTDDLSDIRATNASIDAGIKELIDRVRVAETVSMSVTRSQKRWWKALLLTSLGVLLDIILTIVIFDQQAQINQAAEDLRHVQEITSGEVLCPLYEILNDSLDPDLDRNGVISEEERTAWALRSKDTDRNGKITTDEEDRFQVSANAIRTGYEALNCVET